MQVKRCDGRNASCLPAAAFAEEVVSWTQPSGHCLVAVFLSTEERRPRGVTVDLLVCHTIFLWSLDGYLQTFRALIFSDLYR